MAKAKVRYKGLSDVRIISRKDLVRHNIAISGDLVWDRSNSFSQIVDLNDDLETVLRNEGTFTISAITDENLEGLEVVSASAPQADESQHEGATTVVQEDGKATQKSKKQ